MKIQFKKIIFEQLWTLQFYLQSLGKILFLQEAPGVGQRGEVAQVRLGGDEVPPVPGEEGEGLLAVVVLRSAQRQVVLHLSLS